MRSSEKRRKTVTAAVCLAVLAAVLWFLDILLYPCTYTRNDIHTVSSSPRDVIVLGTSNGKSGIDPDYLLAGTGLTGHNLCVGGEYPIDSYYLLKLVLEKQKPSFLIYEVDPGYYTIEKEFGNNYLLFYHEFPLSRTKLQYYLETLLNGDFRTVFFPSYEYPLSDEIPKTRENLREKLAGKYDISLLKNEAMEYHENGFIERYPVEIENFPAYSPMEFSRETVREENLRDLDRIIDLCEQNNVTFYAVATPLYGGTLQSESETMQEAWGFFAEYFENKGLPFINFNGNYYKAFSHEAKCFVDYEGHMNGDAARAFSARLGEILFADQKKSAAES